MCEIGLLSWRFVPSLVIEEGKSSSMEYIGISIPSRYHYERWTALRDLSTVCWLIAWVPTIFGASARQGRRLRRN